jgi:hypothetical protein
MKTVKYLNDETIFVEVSYEKGGIGYFSGAVRKRGYRLRIQPCTVVNNIVSFAPMSGRSVSLCEVGRRNDKKHAALWAKIEPHAQAIADLFTSGNFGTIPVYIKEKVLL